MKKLLFSLLFAVAYLPCTWAQQDLDGSPDTSSIKTTETTQPTDDSWNNQPFYWAWREMPKAIVGIRGGVNLADMRFTYDLVDRYTHFKQIGVIGGLFVHVPIRNTPLSLRPEVSFISRGDSLTWLDVKYGMKANYLDFRLPITWNFRFRNETFSPYVMVVPQVGLALGGHISYDAEDFYKQQKTIALTKAGIKSTDAALMVGAGVDFKIDTRVTPLFVSVEGGYNFGLINNLAEREIVDNSDNPSTIYNDFFGAELWRNKRFNRGIELAVRVGIPLDSDYLGRHRSKFIIKPDTVVRVEIKTDTLTLVETKIDTVIKEVTKVVKTIVRDTVKYQTKECFTISEIYNLLEQGVDIAGKRICMFNINFDFNKATIREESYKPLNEMARLMYEYPDMRIEVYGHTDSIGTAEYNQKLSERRAQAVVEYFGKQSISPNRIKAFGYGLKYPIDTNSTEEGRFRNRRVEFEILTIGEKKRYD